MDPGASLPLASLRLLVPPVQLMTASMWRVLKKKDVMNYWNVAEFVSGVVDMVPELLMNKHRSQLDLGLRARFILELCQHEQLIKPESIFSYLDKIKSTRSDLIDAEEEELTVNFLNLIQTLLKDPEERQDFFLDIFPAVFGPQYDSDLLMLFSEFLCRLAQLLPVPNLQQTASWLGIESSVLEDCSQTVSKSTELKHLLLHHKNLGLLEQHVPPYGMGENVLSSLSAVYSPRVAAPTEQPDQSNPAQDLSDDTGPLVLVDDVAVEIITISDFAEVEVCLSPSVETVLRENHAEVESTGTAAGVPQGGVREEEEEEDEEEANPHTPSSLHRATAGPHDCPHCKKKFKFASSLLAHSVIHTGERPHQCSDCGRSFSFRQSLKRHKQTHKTGRTYDCLVCKESFRSLSARTEHKQTHMDNGAYSCNRCDKKFSWELSLTRHLKNHAEDHGGTQDGPDDGPEDGPEDGEAAASISEANGDADGADGEEQPPGDAARQCQGSSAASPEPACPAPEPDIHRVTVRTSGRKRTPTMKIRVINLQKRMSTEKMTDVTRVNAPAQRPLPFICSEHSYGSAVGSKDGDESSSADASSAAFSSQLSEEVQVQQKTDKAPSAERNSALQILPEEEGLFTCLDCDKSFKFPSLLKAHRRVHTGEQPFSCSQCGQRFSFKQSMDRHRQTHKSTCTHKCLICRQIFKSAAEQREHDGSHMENGEYLCSECGRTFPWRSGLVRHLKTHGTGADAPAPAGDSHKCPRCHQGFSCKSYLNRHLQTHKEERVHTCNCGKSFAYRAALTAHQRIHQKERPHACKQCGKGFLYKGGLLSHMKIHSEEMPFMCSFCGKSFKRERNMKKHERCHTRENVFSCSQCDKSFVYKATLVRHELTHSGERPYLCSDCGKGFFSHAELLKHERFHTGHKPFQCPYCGKKFTQSCYLTIHLRYHTGVRPYSCAECDKSFLSANRLKRHQRTHSGEKPYLCVECGKGFRQSYHLKMHQQTHVS
ncbi:zinc finger protein 311-like [Cololabis saira]|uniref:zinc finger protein 311-like n=1 Tax=Cololabis saira TaxID=129043 RepID=UPI002AD4A6AF|nr:zinc finger protein 311-like [Cololabis saira]